MLMDKNRLEAFSDGVIAVIITIMRSLAKDCYRPVVRPRIAISQEPAPCHALHVEAGEANVA